MTPHQTSAEPFIGFIMHDQTYIYDVFLVNPTDTNYARVTSYTGGYMSVDEDLMETSRSIRELGVLPPKSSLKIESGDWDELDFTIWFHLDLYESHATDPQHTWFELPRCGNGYHTDPLPILQCDGMRIVLKPRSGRNIQEDTKDEDLKPKYWKHGEGRVV